MAIGFFGEFKMNYKWVALSVTVVGTFMAALDSTVVVIGLPTILENLHASIVHGIWIITGYALIVDGGPVLFGRLADLYGRIRLYNLGFAIFTAGSLLCALSSKWRTVGYLSVFPGYWRCLTDYQQYGYYYRRFSEGRTWNGTWNYYHGCQLGCDSGLYREWRNDSLFWVEIPYFLLMYPLVFLALFGVIYA